MRSETPVRRIRLGMVLRTLSVDGCDCADNCAGWISLPQVAADPRAREAK